MASVFISHSSRDGALVEEIAAGLRDEERHTVFVDRHPRDGIAVGEDWEQVLYDRLHSADVVVCVVTENQVASRWCFAEVTLAKALGRPLLPVRAQAGVRHPLLTAVQDVDYLTDPAAARALLRARLAVLEAGGGAAWKPGRPVFPGLVSFDTADAPVFFGRGAEIDRLASLVRSLTAQRAAKAIVVVGASGSGKSSLVRAGLIPRLVVDGWLALPPMSPGREPLRDLAVAVGQAWRVLRPDRRIDLGELSRQVTEDFAGVTAELLLAAPGSRHSLLVVVDQFEEVFTRSSGAGTERFLAVLGEAAEAGRASAVVATMRSEFLTELLACRPAGAFRNSQFPLVPLDRAGLAGIVRQPARMGRLTFSDDLVERLVADTGAGEALPLLAYVLRELTEHVPPGGRVDVREYELLGGVRGALQRQADSALRLAVVETGLTAEAVLVALVGLVSLDAEGRPTRRRVARSAIPEPHRRAFDIFVDARLISSGEVAGEPQYAVSHEALFTAWPQLSEAIAGQALRLQRWRRLERAAADWREAAEEPSMLWRGSQLRQAREALADAGSAPAERRFVEAGLAAEAAGRQVDADILADRIRAAGLINWDSELALLFLLAAADEYAPTAAVIGGLRQALARHRLIGRLSFPDVEVTALAVSGDAVVVADVGSNRPSTVDASAPPVGECRVVIRRPDTGEAVRGLRFPGRRIGAVDLRGTAADGRLAVGIDNELVVVDLRTETPIFRIDVAESPIREVSLSQRGDQALASVEWGPGVLVAVPSGIVLSRSMPPFVDGSSRFEGPDDAITGEDWPATFRSAGWDGSPRGTVEAFSVPQRRVVRADRFGIAVLSADPVDVPTVIGQVDGRVRMLRWRPDGRVLAVTEQGGVVDVRSHETYGSDLAVIAVSGDGSQLLLDHPLRLHDLASGSERVADDRVADVRCGAFAEDGRSFAVATGTALSVFDVPSGRLINRFGRHHDKEGDVYSGVAFNHDGTRLMTASVGGGRAHVWDIATGRQRQPMPPSSAFIDVSPDGAPVVTRAFRDSVADLAAGVEVLLYTDATLLAAPDRQSLLVIRVPPDRSPEDDRIVEEYSLADGHPLYQATQPCRAGAFSPDAARLALAHEGTVVVTPSRTAADVLTRARRHVFRPLTLQDRKSYALDR